MLVEREIEAILKFPDQNPNPVLRTSADGILLYANPASRELLAAIGGVIEKHMIEIGFLEPRQKPEFVATASTKKASCPRCGELSLVFQEGCATCLSCGFSKCS